MKLQYLTVIFILIILPISLVLTQYFSLQIDSINKQSTYSKFLSDATYDTIKSFQLNTVNNRYSSVTTSKLRDLNSASNTFFNALGTTMAYSREDLEQHVPAIIYTLYDGYYIYTKSETNHITQTNNSPTPEHPDGYVTESSVNVTEFSLKPYVYYSETYVNENNPNQKVIINYTLDNYITVFYFNPDAATINDKYITRSGYYIDASKINLTGTDYSANAHAGFLKIEYDGVEIKEEKLRETLLFEDGTSGAYDYIKYGNKKVYYDPSSTEKFFWYENYKKTPIYDNATIQYLNKRIANTVSSRKTFIK